MTLSLKQQRAHLQQGAALIAVLVILVVITLLGVTAMRMGITSLALATNSQVVQVLFQSADIGTNQLVNSVNEMGNDAIGTNGILAGDTGVLCVTPVNGAKFKNLTSNVCNADNSSSYLNESKIVLAQVNYQKQDVEGVLSSAIQTSNIVTGQSTNPLGQTQMVKVFSTAVIPSFGSASTDTINACLGNTADDSENVAVVTITDCLTNAGAVFTTHESEYKINQL